MPQLDQTLLFNQIFWLFFSFIYLYILFIYHILPSFLIIFKTRKHLLDQNMEKTLSLKNYLKQVNFSKKQLLLDLVKQTELLRNYNSLPKRYKKNLELTKFIITFFSSKIFFSNIVQKI